MAGGVLALDLATRTGWALGRIPNAPVLPLEAAVTKPPKPMSGHVRFGAPGCPAGEFFGHAHRWIVEMLEAHRPGGLIYEKPILPQKTNPETVLRLNGLAAVVLMAAHTARIGWVHHCQPSSVKKFVCGNGGPGKDNVQAALKSWGWAFETDDEADALAAWAYATSLANRQRRAA